MKTIDIFAGCGGMSLGFMNEGFNVAHAFDNWEKAINIYKTNFKHDISDIDLSNHENSAKIISKHKPFIIIGGPLCQDFSHAGKRKEGDRADLTISFAKIIQEVKPEWFVMENVDRIVKSNSYIKARKIFKESYYGLTEKVIDSSYCGVPQKRKRFFCVGVKNAEDGFLDEIIQNNLSTKPMTVRDYFGEELDIEYFYRHPRNYNRRGIFSIDEPSPTIRGVNRPVPKGYPGHPGDPIKKSSKLRPLTTIERARIQTFPKDFYWEGSKTELEQMIGNAVPVKMAEFIAKCINEYIDMQNTIIFKKAK